MPDPALEVALSLSVLSERVGPADLQRWRRHVKRRLLDLAKTLFELPTTIESLPETMDAIVSALISKESTPGPSLDNKHGSGGDASSRLGHAIREYYRKFIVPFWPGILSRVENDLSLRARIALYGGFEQLLISLGTDVRWEPPELWIPYRAERRMYLAGQGLLVVPSFFCWQGPIVVPGTPAIAYPILRDVRSPQTILGDMRMSTEDSLVALLGRTRAAILRACQDACNTSELGARTGVSASTASEHASVLRAARLIASHRRRNEIVHSVTPLGAALLAHHMTAPPVV